MRETSTGLLDTAKNSAESAAALFFDPVSRLGPLKPLFKHSGRGLSFYGRLVMFGSVTALMVAMFWAQLVNIDAGRRRVRELLDALFTQTGEIAMTTPRGPSQLPTSPITESIRVTTPPNNATVGPREVIAGTAPEGNADLWVVIHPLDTSSYWVQPKITVGDDGKWTGITYLGRSESVDAGKRFEIRVVLAPAPELKEGEVLSDWPRAKAVSAPIILQRH